MPNRQRRVCSPFCAIAQLLLGKSLRLPAIVLAQQILHESGVMRPTPLLSPAQTYFITVDVTRNDLVYFLKA